MSLKLKLGVLLLVIVALLSGSLWVFTNNAQQLEDIATRRRQGQVLLFTSEKLALSKLILQSDLPDKKGAIDKAIDDVFLMQAAINANLRIEKQTDITASLRDIQPSLAAVSLLFQDFQARVAAGQELTQEDLLRLDQLDIIISEVETTVIEYEQYLDTEEKQVLETTNLFEDIILAAVVATIVAASLIVFFNILSPINALTQSARELTRGNYAHQVKVQSRDELGQLGEAFNTMTSRLSEFIATLEERVAARTKDLATVAEVGTATATILETDRLLQEVVDLTKERFNLYHSHIYLLDEAGENLVLAAGAGEAGRQMMAKGLSIPASREQSLVARAARERKGVTVNDVTKASDFLPNPLLPDTRSELAVPMIVGGKVIGVFDIQSDAVGRFTESDINIQITLAAQVSTSIQNVRSFERTKSQAELESLVNAIGQKIQRTTSMEDTLQTAIRELGLALGASIAKIQLSARAIQPAQESQPEEQNA